MKQAFLHFQFYLITWLSRNKDRWPRYLVLTACAGCALFLAAAMLTAVHPYGSEIAQNALIGVGLFINAALAAISILLIVAAFAWQFGKGISIEFTTPTNLLPSGWQEPDISPDILIISRPGESDEDAQRRLEDAREKTGPNTWVVVIPFQYSSGAILNENKQVVNFMRNWPPFQDETWTPDQYVCSPNAFFSNETEKQYRDYVERFCYYFREWSPRAKFVAVPNAVKLEILRAAVALLFLLFSVALPAQNRSAVERAIGTHIREIPAAKSQIEYIFDNGKTHFRTGDGRRNYIQLLEGLPGGFRYPSAAFIAVTKNGELVAKADAAGDVATTKEATMRPYSQAVEVPGIGMPDSMEMAQYAEQFRQASRYYSDQAQQSIVPWWQSVTDSYWDWFWLILILTAAPWFFAALSADEGFWELYRPMKLWVVMMTGVSAMLFITNCILKAKLAGAPNWLLAGIAIAVCLISYYVVRKLNPDFRPARGNAPIRHRGGDDNPTLYLPK